MTSVLPLKDKNREPDSAVIETLEVALEKARSGELRSVVLVGDLIGNRTFTAYSTDNLSTEIGNLSFMLHKLCAAKTELVEE